MNIELKRKHLVLGIILLLGIALIYSGWSTINSYESQFSQQLQNAKSNLSTLVTLVETRQSIIQEQLGVFTGSLSGYLENKASEFNFSDGLRMNTLPETEQTEGFEVVRATIESMNLDQALNFIYDVENNRPRIIFTQLEISRAFNSEDELQLSFDVLVRKR